MKNIFDLALGVARMSPDFPKIGSVLYNPINKLPLEIGYNTYVNPIFARDPEDKSKLKYIIHAEANVITVCANKGIQTANKGLVVVGKCVCHECAKIIAGAGVQTVYCPPPDKESSWVESNETAIEIMKEAGISVILLPELIMEGKGINNGER